MKKQTVTLEIEENGWATAMWTSVCFTRKTAEEALAEVGRWIDDEVRRTNAR